MVGRGRSGVPGFSRPTSCIPTISVQNWCDSSISRTLRTRWLTPTGVTARSGAAGLLSVIVRPREVWPAILRPVRTRRKRRRGAKRPRLASPERRAQYQSADQEHEENHDKQKEQQLCDAGGRGRNAGKTEQRRDKRDDEKKQGQSEHRRLRARSRLITRLAPNQFLRGFVALRNLVDRILVGDTAQLALFGDRHKPLSGEQRRGLCIFDYWAGGADRLRRREPLHARGDIDGLAEEILAIVEHDRETRPFVDADFQQQVFAAP